MGKGETRGRFTTKSCVCVCACAFVCVQFVIQRCQIAPGRRTFSVVVSPFLHSCLLLTCGTRKSEGEGGGGGGGRKRCNRLFHAKLIASVLPPSNDSHSFQQAPALIKAGKTHTDACTHTWSALPPLSHLPTTLLRCQDSEQTRVCPALK